MRLFDKKAIVTGAGGAFGREIALTFAREGADVVLADVNLGAARDVAREVEAAGRAALPLEVDVANEAQVERMRDAALERFGRIDILINNAGVARSAPIQEITMAMWSHTLGVNLTGTFLCTRAVIDHMIANQYGKIVNLSSICGQTGRMVGVDYASTKAGIIGFTRTVALQVAKYGINVNAVAPGPIQTPIFEKTFPPEVVERLKATIPFKRMGFPKDIANLILFLSSDEAEWITGETIAINGGAFMG